MKEEAHQNFEWNRLLFNDLPVEFLLEVIFRSVIMFGVVLLALRMTGKRGVRQLSIFETVLIIALGSAAGDPMFYEDVGMIPALTVFLVIIFLYRFVTWLTGKSKRFEEFVEGVPVCLITEGHFAYENFKKEVLAQDEFFTELRIKSIEHLGQVRNAYLEPSGELSVYYYEDKDVRYGLPLRPELFSAKNKTIHEKGMYACTFCGTVAELESGTASCKSCGNSEWVRALNTRRIV